MEFEYKTNPVKAIRQKCLDCCCWQAKEVELCPTKKCPIWPFRFGKNPYRTYKEISEERRQELAEHLAAAREAKKAKEGGDGR